MLRLAALTALALLAFAANSVLCRWALVGDGIDEASFTALRLGSGALLLGALVVLQRGARSLRQADPVAALCLFVYAAAFSFAYRSLSAGAGALILFGCVQLTMMLTALGAGERPGRTQWLGLVAAFGGLVVLVLPGWEAPDPSGAILMAAAGVGWGWYSLRGRGARDPVAVTAGNFLLAAPLGIFLPWVVGDGWHADREGALLAVTSGAVTSGLGYVVWYAALRGLTATRASIVQLSVPILAAWGGVAFLDERVESRLVISAALILGGVALSLVGRERRTAR